MSEKYFNFLNTNPEFISDVNPNLKCKLCSKVMVNARFTPCACEFCQKCICDYLESGNNKCPGHAEECSNEIIRIEDIKESRVTTAKINRLLVKCTNEFCDYEDQVVKVVRHLETCDKTGLFCALMEFGCITEGLDAESLKFHMRENEQKHLNILVNLNKKLQKHLSQMEVDKVHLDNENKELKEKIGELEKKEEKLMTEMCKEIKSQYEEMKIKFDKINGQMKNRLDNLEDVERRCERLEMENKEIKEEIVEIKMEVGMANLRPFKWILEGVEEKSKSTEVNWSPAFYSGIRGYKIQVGIRFYSFYYVAFCCRILKSDNDNKLIWPCRKSISIKWINQNVGTVYENVVIKFHGSTGCRPRNDQNTQQNSLDCYFFKPPFINNQVHILCEVE